MDDVRVAPILKHLGRDEALTEVFYSTHEDLAGEGGAADCMPGLTQQGGAGHGPVPFVDLGVELVRAAWSAEWVVGGLGGESGWVDVGG